MQVLIYILVKRNPNNKPNNIKNEGNFDLHIKIDSGNTSPNTT